jgi:hypothetical protein
MTDARAEPGKPWPAGIWAQPTARGSRSERTHPGVLLRLTTDDPRVWDLSAILPG